MRPARGPPGSCGAVGQLLAGLDVVLHRAQVAEDRILHDLVRDGFRWYTDSRLWGIDHVLELRHDQQGA